MYRHIKCLLNKPENVVNKAFETISSIKKSKILTWRKSHINEDLVASKSAFRLGFHVNIDVFPRLSRKRHLSSRQYIKQYQHSREQVVDKL